jgi:methionyl-tRNA formyltransferase
MRLVYYGTPALAVPPLERLHRDGRAPILVVTRPDKPSGRGLESGPSPVRRAAESLGLPVATPERAGAADALAQIRALAPDLLVVAAYGQIFPSSLLTVARLGALNLHYSLLPRWRGAAPVQAAIVAGDPKSGVTTMWMTEGLDEGPIFLARATPIGPDEDAGALGARLAALGSDCLAETLDRIERGEIAKTPQDSARATFAPKVRSEDARLRLDDAAPLLARRVRAYTPEPGAYLALREGRLLILSAEAGDADAPSSGGGAAPGFGSGAVPGTILRVDPSRGLLIALAKGALWLRRVKPAGRREMGAADYANGARLKPRATLPLEDAA